VWRGQHAQQQPQKQAGGHHRTGHDLGRAARNRGAPGPRHSAGAQFGNAIAPPRTGAQYDYSQGQNLPPYM
jgi:hypothetical protein